MAKDEEVNYYPKSEYLRESQGDGIYLKWMGSIQEDALDSISNDVGICFPFLISFQYHIDKGS